MPWAFQGISSLSSALEAFQTQIDVTGQNIANVNTAGYARETTNLAEAPGVPVTYGGTFDVGGGVTVESVSRIQSGYLQTSANNTNSDLGMANSQADTTASVNAVVADPNDTGLATSIDAFFNSWSSLASSPTSANQLAVQQAGQNLATNISGVYGSIDTIKQGAQQQITGLLQQAQGYVNQIASLNAAINKGTIDGSVPNDLLDQRDAAVSSLSSIMNVTVTKSADGTESVSSGNLILVNQSGARTVPTNYDAATGTLSDANGTYSISSGQVAGLFDSVNKLNSYESNLNTMADQLRSSVNTLYATASNSSGTTGGQFFASGSGAASLALSSTVASDPSTIVFGTSGSASDTGVAQAIAGVATQSMAGLGNQTVSGYYSSLVSQIGVDGENAANSQSTQSALSSQVTAQIQSISGVNIDTEMSNLLQFQRSYQAAAQALSAMDQTTQSLLSTLQTA